MFITFCKYLSHQSFFCWSITFLSCAICSGFVPQQPPIMLICGYSLINEFTLIENYEKNNNKFLVEIHKKFTLAVACILFTLVGAPLGILVKRGGITIASALSIAFFLIYYILLIWGEQLADRALLDPAIGSWMPNIILLIVGLIILFLSDKKN